MLTFSFTEEYLEMQHANNPLNVMNSVIIYCYCQFIKFKAMLLLQVKASKLN